jgi:hypothetical protein
MLDGIILHLRVSVTRRLVLIRIIPLDAESWEIHDNTESEDGGASPVGGWLSTLVDQVPEETMLPAASPHDAFSHAVNQRMISCQKHTRVDVHMFSRNCESSRTTVCGACLMRKQLWNARPMLHIICDAGLVQRP